MGFNVIELIASAYGSFIKDVSIISKEISNFYNVNCTDYLYFIGHSRGGLIALKASLDNRIKGRIKYIFPFNTPIAGVEFARRKIRGKKEKLFFIEYRIF